MKLWVVYAFISFGGYFFYNLLAKFVSKNNPFVALIVLYACNLVFMLILILSQKIQFSINSKSLLIIAIMSLSSIVGAAFALKAIRIAPNPGYATAIFSSNFFLVTLASVLIFQSELTMVKFFGILATLIGLILLSI